MRIIITADGSPTCHNGRYGEAYHSMHGAVAEAVGKYARPCGLAEAARLGRPLRLLDVGFGLGYNSAAALDLILAADPDARVGVDCLENDPAALAAIAGLEPPLAHYGLIKALAAAPGQELAWRGVRMRLRLADARHSLADLTGPYDAVFHDPFTPRKNPELWTAEVLARLAALMAPGAVLATFSCAGAVRGNLRAAGLVVSDGPSMGRRGPSTLARRPRAD